MLHAVLIAWSLLAHTAGDLSATGATDELGLTASVSASATLDRYRRSWIILDDARLMAPPERVPGCEARLTEAGVRFSAARITPHWNPSKTILCGAEQVVRFHRGPGNIRWSSAPRLSCRAALALAQFEQIVREEAAKEFKSRVYAAQHIGTYACREMAAYEGWISEHSYANAIDISMFTLASGRRISVRDHYFSDGAEGRFLRAIARRAFEEAVFSVVLTPAFDARHKDHFHLDMAHYRVGEL